MNIHSESLGTSPFRLTTPATMDPPPVLSPQDDATISGEFDLDQIRSLLENAERRMQGEKPSMIRVPSLHHNDRTLPKWVSLYFKHLIFYAQKY